MINTIFMGTPDFAVPSLQALIDCDEFNIIEVITQPDKPVGRKQILTAPPVKELAIANQLKVFQPERMKDESTINHIVDLQPDLIVVIAYGKILPKEIIDLPKYSCINVHASLLPMYRGAAPIQWAIIDGQKKTGVTIMKMDEGLDTGDILSQSVIDIDPNCVVEELFNQLSVLGAKELPDTILKYINGEIIPIQQGSSNTSYAKMVDKSISIIDWNNSSTTIHNLIRGLSGWPTAKSSFRGKDIKIHRSEFSSKELCGNVGEIVIENNSLYVICGDKKGIKLLEVQPLGKSKMSISDFINGYQVKNSEKFV